VDKKIDYAPLIADAMKNQGMTRYAIAKALGFKSVSVIYRIEKGTAGMSTARLMQLLKLAGRLAVLLVLGALLFFGQAEVSQAKSRSELNVNTHYAHLRRRFTPWARAARSLLAWLLAVVNNNKEPKPCEACTM
jgi:transcriptional regulator with XRE-family HTH domain